MMIANIFKDQVRVDYMIPPCHHLVTHTIQYGVPEGSHLFRDYSSRFVGCKSLRFRLIKIPKVVPMNYTEVRALHQCEINMVLKMTAQA